MFETPSSPHPTLNGGWEREKQVVCIRKDDDILFETAFRSLPFATTIVLGISWPSAGSAVSAQPFLVLETYK